MAATCKRAAGILVSITMFMMPVISVWAQRAPVYSLADLVDSARHHLPVLLQKQALVSGAEAGITEAQHAFLPKLNVVEELSIGTANDLTGGFLPMPGVLHAISGGVTAANNYQPATSNIASVYGEYELVNFGLRGARVSSARAFAGVQKADFAKELYMVKWQIGKVYFQILKGRYQLALEEEDIRRYQSIYTISSALTSTGINAGVDSSLAKAELSRTRINYNRATGNLVRLQQQLAYLTGVSNPQIRVDSGAGMTQEERMGLMNGIVPGNGLGAGSGAGLMNGIVPGMNPRDGVGLDTGRMNRPGAGNGTRIGGGTGTNPVGGNGLDLVGVNDPVSAGSGAANPLADYFAKQKLQYQAEELLIRKSYLPKIIVGAGGWARGSSIQYSNDYKSLGEGMGYQRLNYMGGLGVTYDLFNGVRKKDRLTVAGYQSAAADLALQQQVLTLRNEELQADETIRIAQKNLTELPVQLQAATDAYNQKLAQYKAGIINLVDLSNASFVLYQAQSAYIETLNEWYTANLDKAAATGNLDQFIQTLK